MKQIIYSIVVPVYCNAATLCELNKRINAVLSSVIEYDKYEIIYVDDGSTDDSLSVLKDIKRSKSNVKVVKHTRNFGASSAVKSGLKCASGKWFVTMAADLQDPPELLPLIIKANNDGHSFVICERSQRDDPLSTKFFSALFYKLVRKFIAPSYPKGGFDMMLFGNNLRELILSSNNNTFLSFVAFWSGVKFYSIKYDRPKRSEGKSKWTFWKSLNSALSIFLGFSVFPIRFFIMLGFFFATLAISYSIYIIFQSVAGHPFVPGFATLVVLISLLLSVVIVLLGLVGEYSYRILDEVSSRPFAMVEDIDD